ncbi:MSC_0623 family F1-like ATPase-associated protein, partial [Mycoplasmopsis bovis]|uniref:MSC_0623 family F1-like ATPase-associated protein n=1 Tax=Mycoplasmopsis bovis TaxID=28903 RepID=UPI003D2E4DF7
LDCNLGFNSHEYVKFSSNFYEALSKKFDIVLEKFVITFNVNHKFSLDALVTMLKSSEDSNTEAVNFASSQEPKFNNLLKLYNN